MTSTERGIVYSEFVQNKGGEKTKCFLRDNCALWNQGREYMDSTMFLYKVAKWKEDFSIIVEP